jgi:hypothetical protein
VFEWLESSPYAIWARESLWGWPIALTVHAFGTAVVVGLIFIIGLRLLGVFRAIPYTALNKLIPIIWFGVVCQVLSGFTLWLTKPAQYMSTGMFETKLSLVVLGIVVTIFFQIVLSRGTATWEAAGTAPSSGVKVFVVVTAVVWAAVLIAGRLTAYLGSLYTS